MDTGLRRENATRQRDKAPFRFNRNGKGSRDHPIPFESGTRMPRPVARQDQKPIMGRSRRAARRLKRGVFSLAIMQMHSSAPEALG